MGTGTVFQISLIASYIAGMVALFAPCCISYLFPAYLGNIFKERKAVLFMTFIYSLGIFVVMMPVVLGAKALQSLFFDLHDTTYLFGGIFMLIVAIISFIGIKLPMPHLAMSQQGQKNDVFSTFTLGIFSGITSACCAPVLIGVVALSTLTPTTFQALGVGAFYVLGMVTPLYLASILIHKKNILEKPILKKVITKIDLFGNTYPIFVSNIVASVIFGLTGIIMLWLTSAGKLGMSVAESAVTKSINNVAVSVSEKVNQIPGIDIIFAIFGIYLFYIFVKQAISVRESKSSESKYKYICPMHPNVTSDKPGKCHKCGGMELIKVESKEDAKMDSSMGGTANMHKMSMDDMGNGDNGGIDYVCPMHPEVTSDKPGKCHKCGMDLVNNDAGDGYDPRHMEHDHESMMATPEAASDFLRRFFIVSVLLVPLAAFSMPAVKYLGVPDFAGREFLEFGIATAIFYFGLVFFEHAKHEIAMRKYGMMTLVSLGVGAGYLFSAASTFIPAIDVEFYLEIATLIWVLLFGHFLEAKSSTAAGDALKEVAKLLPKTAHLISKSGTKEVAIDTLNEGDRVLVKAGEKVPADGIIIKGSANFNESHLTGESRPVAKNVKDEVSAGSINIDGSVEVELTRVGESSTIGQIENLIASAKQTKPSAQKLADRAAGWLTFTALAVSLTTLLIWALVVGETLVFSATLAITVLVIACPHALGLAIPTVSTIATRLAVKNGVFIKDMAKIEVVKAADYVIFDKTGTLTEGNFTVSQIISVEKDIKDPIIKKLDKLSKKQKEILKIAASIEKHSSHVIGASIVEFSKKKKIKTKNVTSVRNIEGKGISGKIGKIKYFLGNEKLMKDKKVSLKDVKLGSEMGTKVYIAKKNELLGLIILSDQVKDESEQAVRELHKLGVKVAMLTGDSKEVADTIAHKIGIDTVFAEVLPEDKYKYVKKLQEDGNVVIMAGDGVNDAPALTQANAGVAIGAGTDVAVEAGDIVLTQSNPEHLVRLLVLSRKVYRKMIENLFWAVGYNVLAIPAAAGLFIPIGFRLTPAIGALLMSLSSVIVVINAMSLRKADLKVA